jgi:hypothetical protein
MFFAHYSRRKRFQFAIRGIINQEGKIFRPMLMDNKVINNCPKLFVPLLNGRLPSPQE